MKPLRIHFRKTKKRITIVSYFNVNGGINVGIRPFTPGYYATTANYLKNPDFNHVDFNIRKCSIPNLV